MKILNTIVVLLIGFCIPAVSVFGAANIALRMPDVYTYEFNNNQIAKELKLGINDDELGQFVSEFMRHRDSDFQLPIDSREQSEPIFTREEADNMQHYRLLLNRSLFIGLGALAIVLISYIILLWNQEKSKLRSAFKLSILVYLLGQIVTYCCFIIESCRVSLGRHIFPTTMQADCALNGMITSHFIKISLIADTAVSAVLMVIMASITWRISKPKRMFWK